MLQMLDAEATTKPRQLNLHQTKWQHIEVEGGFQIFFKW